MSNETKEEVKVKQLPCYCHTPVIEGTTCKICNGFRVKEVKRKK